MKKTLLVALTCLGAFSTISASAAVKNKDVDSSYWNNFHTVTITKGVYASHIKLEQPASNSYKIGSYYIPAHTKIKMRSQFMGTSWIVSASNLGLKNNSNSYWSLPYNFKGFK